MEAGKGCSSEIEMQDAVRVSYDQPVTKKPKLLSRQDQGEDEDEDQDLSDESTSEDEPYVNSDDEYDYTSHIPKPLQREEKRIKSGPDLGPELNEIRRKIDDLKSKDFNGISFTAKCISDAYKCLHIFSDPRGLKIKCTSYENSYEPESDVAYLQLLKKYRDSGKISNVNWQLSEVWKLRKGFNLRAEDMYLSLEDYLYISGYVESVKQWLDVRDFLLDPKSKEEYRKDPKTFAQNLEMNYGLIHKKVLKIVVKWWEDDSEEQIGEGSRSLIDNACKHAIDHHNNRLNVWWEKADYVKLKLDVARLVGIYKNIPDEIADFVLPGHFKWYLEEETFVPVPYEAVESCWLPSHSE